MSTRAVRRCLAITMTVLTLASACGVQPDRLVSQASTCLGSTAPSALSSLFASEPGDVIAADYQRAIGLPDGRTLWLFQDATIRLPPPVSPTTTVPGTTVPEQPPEPPPPTERLLHNIAMLQTGACFDVLRTGTAVDPGPWLFAEQTTPFGHWFWPLDATMGADGRLYVFMAEMIERGPLYLARAEPVSTRIVGIDLESMTPVFVGTPADSSASLYGFSIANDESWTYLYAQCHRQFGYDPGDLGVPAHDLSCSGRVTVARVPLGRVFDQPTYWNGIDWGARPADAAAVIPTDGRRINPSQIRWSGTEFVAVTKVDDWFGNEVHLDRAPTAVGPWTTYARMAVEPRCSPRVCNTYFASWVPSAETTPERYVVGISHNRWDGQVSQFNRPTYFTVPAPGRHSLATRCSHVDC